MFGYPQDEAARVSSQAIAEFLEANDTIREVRLVFFQRRDAEIFLKHQEFEHEVKSVTLERVAVAPMWSHATFESVRPATAVARASLAARLIGEIGVICG